MLNPEACFSTSGPDLKKVTYQRHLNIEAFDLMLATASMFKVCRWYIMERILQADEAARRWEGFRSMAQRNQYKSSAKMFLTVHKLVTATKSSKLHK